jgi:PAS domain S-box-containing protein
MASRHWRGLAGLIAVLYLAGLAGLVRLAGFSFPVLAGWLVAAGVTAGLLYLLRRLAPPARTATGPLSAEVLLAVEERFRNLAEIISEPLAVLDGQLRYQYFNAAAEQFLGKPAAAVLGKTPEEAFGASYSNQLKERMEACRRVMQTGVPEVVTSAISYNGCLRHLEVAIYPTREGGVLTVKRDFTGQYDAEQQYRDLAESIADIFYALDREMRFTYWNKACEQFRGLPAAEVLGKHIHEIFPLTPNTGMDQAIRHALATGEPGSTVNRYTAGGVEYYFDISAYPTRHGVAVFGKDVTARKRIEEELQENTRQLTATVEALAASEHKLRAVLDAMLGYVSLFSPEGRLLDCNQTSLQANGLPKADLVGKPLADTYWYAHSAAEGQKATAAIRKAATGETVRFDTQVQAHGGLRYLDVCFSPLRDADGRVVQVVASGIDVTERKEAEESLRFYQYLVENTHDPVYWISPEDNFTFYYVNQATCRHFGYPAEHLRTLSIPDWDPRFTLPDCFALWNRLKAEKSLLFETEHRCADGRVIPVEVSTSLITYQGREYFAGYFKDIQERNSTQRVLTESEQRYRSLFESNQDAVFLVDLETYMVVDANPAAARIYGYSREELLQLRHLDLSAEPEKTLQMMHERALSAPLRFHRKKDGTVFPVELVKSYLQINGREYGMASVRDISERLQAEQQVHELQQRLKGIIDSAMDAILTIDEAGRIVMFNTAAERMFGYPEAEIAGQSIEKLMPETFRNGHHQFVTRYAESGAPTRMLDAGRPVHALRRDGELFPVEASISQTSIKGKKYYTAILRDITERVRNTQKLEEEKQRLEMAILGAGLGFWDWKPEANQAVYNEQWASMLGYALPEIAPTFEAWSDLIHPDDYPNVIGALDYHLAGNSPYYQVEHRLRAKNGEWKWVSASGKVVSRAANGKVLRVIGTHLDVTDRKRSEEEIRKLALVAQNTDNAVIITDAEGHIEWVNDSFTRISGYSAAEAVGRKSGQVLQGHATDPAAVEQMREAIRNGQGFDLEVLNYHKNGQPYWLHITAQPVFDDRGNVRHYVAIETDITERKEVEAQLHFQASVLRSVKDSVIVTDLQGRTTYFNQGAEEIFGYTAEEMLGKTLSILYPLGAPVRLAERFKQIMAGMDFSGEWEGRRKDGSHVWLHIKTSLLRDAAGQPVGYLGVSKDITDRKLAEKKLRESEANLRSIFDASVQTYFLLDPSYRILNFNRAAAGFIRQVYGIELLEGDNMLDFVDPKSIADLRRNVSRAFGGEKVVVTIQIDHPGRPGLWVEDQYLPTYDDAGQVFGVAFVSLDVTDRKRAEEAIMELNASLERRVAERTAQLQSINKELEAFSYSVSHDLRAPLRSIDGFSKAVLEDYGHLLDAEGQDYLQSIRMASQRMGQLIDDLLKLSRVTRGEMQHELVNLTQLVLDYAQELRRAEPNRQVSLSVAPDLHVLGDPKLLRIALHNLVGNAWKFTSRRENACIEVGRIDQEGQTVFYVRDNGAGFNMKYVDKLFGAFHRLHANSEFEGTGIGLATVHRIIRRHGGQIWAESEEGKGAAFYFTVAPSLSE